MTHRNPPQRGEPRQASLSAHPGSDPVGVADGLSADDAALLSRVNAWLDAHWRPQPGASAPVQRFGPHPQRAFLRQV